MTKSELTKQLIQLYDSPIMCLQEIARHFRMSRDRASEMMRGCQCEKRGRGLYFFASDVAERYLNLMEVF